DPLQSDTRWRQSVLGPQGGLGHRRGLMQPPPASCMGLRVLYFHPAILGPPLVEGRFAGAVDRATPMRCSTPTSRLLLWQDRNDLLSAEPATLHSSVALTVVGPYLNLEEFRG